MKVSKCGQDDCPTPYEFCEACIRADEREQILRSVRSDWQMSAKEYRADLRDKVEALPDSIGRSGKAAGALIWRGAVLALFDETDK